MATRSGSARAACTSARQRCCRPGAAAQRSARCLCLWVVRTEQVRKARREEGLRLRLRPTSRRDSSGEGEGLRLRLRPISQPLRSRTCGSLAKLSAAAFRWKDRDLKSILTRHSRCRREHRRRGEQVEWAMRTSLIIILALLPLACAGGLAGGGNGARISGVITDASSGLPIKGAHVSFGVGWWSDGTRYATAGEAGAFEIDVPEGARGRLEAFAAGYFDLQTSVTTGFDEFVALELHPQDEGRKCERGRYLAGIGARLGYLGHSVVVEEVSRGGPAVDSRLPPGFLIEDIDGQQVAGLDSRDVVMEVIGQVGSEMVLSGRRDPSAEREDISITRAPVFMTYEKRSWDNCK